MVPTALETLILLIESMIRLLEEVSLPRARLFGLPLPFSNPAARATADIRRIAEALRAIAAERATQFQPPAPQAPPPAPQARIPSPEMARKLPPYPNKSPTPPKAALLFHGLVPALPDLKQNQPRLPPLRTPISLRFQNKRI